MTARLLLWVLPLIALGSFARTGAATPEEQIDRYADPHLGGEAFVVDTVTLTGDRLSAELHGGVLVPVLSAGDDLMGYVYVGDGTLRYDPEDETERYQLERKTGHSSFDGPLNDAFVLTDDPDVLASLAPAPDGPRAAVPARAFSVLRERFDEYADPKWGLGVGLEVLRILREANDPAGPGHVYAEFGFEGLRPYSQGWLPRRFGWITYLHDPHGVIDRDRSTALLGHQSTSFGHFLEIWTCHGPVEPPPIDLVSVDMDLTVPPGGPDGLSTIHNTVGITFTAVDEPVNAVALDLVSQVYSWSKRRFVKFEVTQVTDYTGAERPFAHHRGRLLVPLATSLAPGQTETLTVSYSGDALFALDSDSYWVLNSWPWFPTNGLDDRATFAATVHYPAHLRMAGTGTTTATATEGDVRTERWEEERPVQFPSMIIGNFTTVKEERTPSGVAVRGFFTPSEDHKAEPAIAETIRIIRFYEQAFGPFPFDEVDIAEMRENMGFWQAPPGLILISKPEGVVEWVDNPERATPHLAPATLAHELAHEYWGHAVGWATGDDQWLSEALAEYSSHLYISHVFGDVDYEARLRSWRKESREDSAFGPVAMDGGRLGRGRLPLWYNKGPYTLHMLHHWIGDKPFLDLLATTYELVDHHDLSTREFQAIAEKALGTDMDWFFGTWIRSTHLPEIEASYRGGTGRGDPLVLTLRQVQDGPPTKLRVPVRITLDKKRKPQWRTVVLEDAEMTVTIEGLAAPVKKVEIDPDQATLWAKDPRPAAQEGSD